MGAISPVTTGTLHNIEVKNINNELIGEIIIQGTFSNREDNSPIKPSELLEYPQRRVISELISVSASVQFKFKVVNIKAEIIASKDEQKALNSVANELDKNKGLKISKSETIVPGNPEFKAALVKHLKSQYNLAAEFLR